MDDQRQESTHSPIGAAGSGAHRGHDHVAAVFPSRDEASAAIDALQALGLGSEHLGVAAHSTDAIVFEHDEDAEWVHDTEVGALIGAPVGAIAGLAVAALAIPGIGLVGLGGMFALAGTSALWGGLIGGYLGAGAGDDTWNTHHDLGYTALQPGEVLVVVCSHGRTDAINEVVAAHSGRLHPIDAAHIGQLDG